VTDTSVHAEELSPYGVRVCRGCRAEGLESILDLGTQPLANELLPSANAPDSLFPLHLRICPSCGLGQVGEFVLPERIFGDYPYLSSVSSSWLAHAKTYASLMSSELRLNHSTLVVEVASNDGYLLREFQELGIPVVGIEPAANVADIARAAGVHTITAFFGRETAQSVVNEHGYPRLVVANNVLAHVPDLDDFAGGLAILCDAETVITVENPSFVTLLNETQFDTIYHEHFSYLSAHAVARVVAEHGLELVRVDNLTTHGGSYRYTIVRKGWQAPDPSVAATIRRELDEGLLTPSSWAGFARRSQRTINNLREWLDRRASRGERVAAYGAAAKGNTLLNAASVGVGDIHAVADGSPEKQGKFLPGTHIPVVVPAALIDTMATDVLILPWNIAVEITPLIRKLLPGARTWVAVPEMREIEG
jgi:C-methyltransferase C-terminal domain/Putative zinc binding domain/Methyltransferase domain